MGTTYLHEKFEAHPKQELLELNMFSIPNQIPSQVDFDFVDQIYESMLNRVPMDDVILITYKG